MRTDVEAILADTPTPAQPPEWMGDHRKLNPSALRESSGERTWGSPNSSWGAGD